MRNAILETLQRTRAVLNSTSTKTPDWDLEGVIADLDGVIALAEKGVQLSGDGCGANATTLDDGTLRISETIHGPCLVIPIPPPAPEVWRLEDA